MVAQFWLEHRPVTPEVASSSLVYPAKKTSHIERSFRFAIAKQTKTALFKDAGKPSKHVVQNMLNSSLKNFHFFSKKRTFSVDKNLNICIFGT